MGFMLGGENKEGWRVSRELSPPTLITTRGSEMFNLCPLLSLEEKCESRGSNSRPYCWGKGTVSKQALRCHVGSVSPLKA